MIQLYIGIQLLSFNRVIARIFPELNILLRYFRGVMMLYNKLYALLLHCGNHLFVLYQPFEFFIYILPAWGDIDHRAQGVLAKDVVTFGLGAADDNLAL